MRQLLRVVVIVALILAFQHVALGNNVVVSNIALTGQNNASDFTLVQFDITWDNSWRVSGGPSNWDAAWVFVKYSTDGGANWRHATLATSGHTAPSGATIDSPEDGKGVFVYRSSDGTGTVNFTGVQLKWQYGIDGLLDNVTVQVKIFAVEMVFVPQAEFAAGSGGDEPGRFTLTTINTSNATTVPLGTGSLGGQTGGFPTGEVAPSNASWPNGFSAFYCMKYEITQQQYADFLNCLTSTQAEIRKPSISTVVSHRFSITGSHPDFSSFKPFVACNGLSWMDGAAYVDWAGLRPMTELEFEKACRGNQFPVVGEFAWGTFRNAVLAYTVANDGAANEDIATNYSTSLDVGNSSHSNTSGDINGPLRVGIFAGNANNTSDHRVRSGATFYGIMEMSGNLWERTVTIGTASGRNFMGTLGDGHVSSNGNADNSDWPGFAAGEVTGASGSGFRGGSWAVTSSFARVSDRQSASSSRTARSTSQGFRGVRQGP